jgi:hypothetical protein
MTYPQDSDKLLLTVEEAARRLSIGRSRRIACRDLESFIEGLLLDSAHTPPVNHRPAQIPPVNRVLQRPRRR